MRGIALVMAVVVICAPVAAGAEDERDALTGSEPGELWGKGDWYRRLFVPPPELRFDSDDEGAIAYDEGEMAYLAPGMVLESGPPHVLCGTVIIRPDPGIDPGIAVEWPDADTSPTEYTIRRMTPPVCAPD